MLFRSLAALCVGSLVALPAAAAVTVYTAQLIRTLEPAMPTATAVAVENGRIVAVGDIESLAPVLRIKGGHIDRQFEDRILVPGFIDPHVHPSLPAVLTQFPFLAPTTGPCPPENFPAQKPPRHTDNNSQRLPPRTLTPPCPSSPGVITRCGTEKYGERISTTVWRTAGHHLASVLSRGHRQRCRMEHARRDRGRRGTSP